GHRARAGSRCGVRFVYPGAPDHMGRPGNSTLVFETGTLSGSGLGEASMTLTLASQRGLVLGFAVIGSIVISAVIILTYGNLAAAYSFLGAFAVALISIYRIDVGLLIFF